MNNTPKKQTEANRKNTKKDGEKTTKTKALAKKYDPKETRKMVMGMATMSCDPDLILEDLGQKLIPKYLNSKGKKKEEVRTELEKKLDKAFRVFGLETHYSIAETVGGEYQPMVMEYARQLIKEHDCKTPTEITLAQTIAASHARFVEYTKRFHSCVSIEWLSSEKNGYYSMLSKEADRAHRQFTSALATLKQLKQPTMEVKINAKAAFVANKQQINVRKNNEGQ